MRQIIDFIPLILFFIVYNYTDIFVATQALMVLTAINILIFWFLFHKQGKRGLKNFVAAEKMPIFTCLMVVIFGALTVYFKSSGFIIWKVTIIYALFAFILFASQFFFQKILIQSMLGKELTLPDSVWSNINIAWILFFLFCALLNLYVGYYLEEATWIKFKTFVFPALVLIFTLFNVAYIYRYISKKTPPSNDTEQL